MSKQFPKTSNLTSAVDVSDQMKPFYLALLVCLATVLQMTTRAEAISEVIPVKFDKAEDVATALTRLSHGETSQLIPDITIYCTFPRPGEFKVVSDLRSNSLLVFASPSDLHQIKFILTEIDRPLSQVLIEAWIYEVRIVDLPSRRRVSRDLQPAIPNKFVPENLFDPRTWTTNFVEGKLAEPGKQTLHSFSYVSGLGGDGDLTIVAMARDPRVTLIQKPRLVTSNGMTASLFIGDRLASKYYGGGVCLTSDLPLHNLADSETDLSCYNERECKMVPREGFPPPTSPF